MANISKYNFDEVEGKLDVIRKDLGTNKVLLGDGTYGDYPDVSSYVTTETLETTVQQTVKEQIKEEVSSADDSAIDDLFS